MEPIALPEYEALPLDMPAKDIAGLRILFVNVYGVRGANGGWTLIDAGLPLSGGRIRRWAAEHFGDGVSPQSIVLTHGHFDHVSALKDLLDHWDVPVYAHGRELPYLTGRETYPPPDPSVGGGLMPILSPMFPREPINIGLRAQPLPEDGSVPGLPGWKWYATPGHAPGHVSLFRSEDGALLVGDAFCTTNQESFLSVMKQDQVLQGPPTYFTPDWNAACRSVRELAALRPSILLPGHGLPMSGPETAEALATLARDFDRIAMPEHRKYVEGSHPGN